MSCHKEVCSRVGWATVQLQWHFRHGWRSTKNSENLLWDITTKRNFVRINVIKMNRRPSSATQKPSSSSCPNCAAPENWLVNCFVICYFSLVGSKYIYIYTPSPEPYISAIQIRGNRAARDPIMMSFWGSWRHWRNKMAGNMKLLFKIILFT